MCGFPRSPTNGLFWQLVAIATKREAIAALPPEEREAARLAQVAARERFTARRAAKQAHIRDLAARVLSGETLSEIAAARVSPTVCP